MRVLIVRLSSMGDVVHTLPALTDAARVFPKIQFDWAVDDAFADIPAWHTHVEKVFPIELRRWRGGLSSARGRAEVKNSLSELRGQSYDAIVDLQGEFKSAFIARLAKGKRYGYDGASAREWGAHAIYHDKIQVPKGMHSMGRMRKLLSQALGYSYGESTVDYGIDPDCLPKSPIKIDRPYVVLIHSTSWASKNWPEPYWRELAASITAAGYAVVMPWGNEDERERSIQIAAEQANRVVLPRLSISDKASIINRASATVGLDTGLSHIAAALGIPSITLYGATDPNLCGAIGENQIHIQSDFECVGCHETGCSFAKSSFKPACFECLTPAMVWRRLEELLRTPVKSDRIYQTA
jgi:heptosyltransferase-1